MWYHYILILVGLYFVGSAIYSIISNRSLTNIILSGVQIVLGGGVAYYGYSAATAPEPVPLLSAPAAAVSGMVGGLRKMLRK